MMLWVGLGNPGGKYAKNRHNIGFMALDEIVRRHSFGQWRSKFSGEVCEGVVDGIKVIALKPTTYMNESGRSVQAAARFYKVPLAEIVVFHDDLDLAFSKIKIKSGGGHGGHNGLRSMDAHMGKDYKRVRLGIGHPGSKEKVHAYVLGDFAKAELPMLEAMISAIGTHSEQIAHKDDVAFMNRYAMAMAPLKPSKKTKDKPDVSSPTDQKGDEKTEESGSPFDVLKSLLNKDR